MAERRAHATWHGSLMEGEGSVALGSGAAGALPVTWKALGPPASDASGA